MLNPMNFGAAGDGLTNDDAAVDQVIAACNATGEAPEFTHDHAVTTRKIITRSGVRPCFHERGGLTATGTGWTPITSPDEDRCAVLQIGPDPTSIAGLSVAADVPVGSDILPLCNASAVPVGSVVQFRWLTPHAPGTHQFGEVARVVGKSGNDLVLSERLSEAIPASTALTSFQHATPTEDVVLTGYRCRNGGATGQVAGLEFSHTLNCRADDVRTQGMPLGIVIAGAIDPVLAGHRSVGDGSWAAVNMFGAVGPRLSDIDVRDCQSFGLNLRFFTDLKLDRATLRKTKPAAGRACKIYNGRHGVLTDLDIEDWYVSGIWVEIESHHLTFVRSHVLRTRAIYNSSGTLVSAALGAAVSHQNCRHITFVEPVLVGTDTNGGGVDFSVASTMSGVSPSDIIVAGPHAIGTAYAGTAYTII